MVLLQPVKSDSQVVTAWVEGEGRPVLFLVCFLYACIISKGSAHLQILRYFEIA